MKIKQRRKNMLKHYRPPSKAERGQMALIFAAGFATIMALFMLTVDFGGMAITYHKAQVATDAAAFAGAQGVDLNRFYSHNELQLSPAVSAGLAGQYMSINGQGNVQITSIHVTPDRVYVTGQATYHSLFAHFVGLGEVNMTVSSSASPAYGIDERDQ